MWPIAGTCLSLTGIGQPGRSSRGRWMRSPNLQVTADGQRGRPSCGRSPGGGTDGIEPGFDPWACRHGESEWSAGVVSGGWRTKRSLGAEAAGLKCRTRFFG